MEQCTPRAWQASRQSKTGPFAFLLACVVSVQALSSRSLAEDFIDPITEIGNVPGVQILDGLQADEFSRWTEVPAGELLDRLRTTPPDETITENTAVPPLAVIESARYLATFSGGALQSGECEFSVIHRGEGAAILDWSEVNVALHDLTEGQRPAIWGTSGDGRRLVVVDSSGSLAGKWNCQSHAALGVTEFSLQLPPALQSRLEIRVPRELNVICPGALVTVTGGPDDALQNWTIDLGRRHSFSLAIARRESTAAAGQVVGGLDVLYSARADGLYLQVDAALWATQPVPQELQLSIPEEVQVTQVTSTGNSLPFERAGSKLSIPLAPLLGTGRQATENLAVRIRGYQPLAWTQSRSLPKLELVNAEEIDRQVRLFVESPLAVEGLRATGLYQTGLQQDELGELWTFIGTDAVQRLGVLIQRPQPKLSLSMNTLADLTASLPLAVGNLEIESAEGSAFQAQLVMGEGWEIVDLQAGTSGSRLSRWESVDEGRVQHVLVEFRQPVIIGARHALRYRARARADWKQSGLGLPVPVLKEGGRHAGSCWLRLTPEIMPPSVPDAILQVEAVDRLPDELRTWIELEDIDGAALERWSWSSTSTLPQQEFRHASPPKSPQTTVPAAPPAPDASTEPRISPEAAVPRGAAPEEPIVAVLPQCYLRLETTVGAMTDRRHVHRAIYDFVSPVVPQVLDLRLPRSAVLSLVTLDGEPIAVTRREDSLKFADQTPAVRRLEVVYSTTGDGGTLLRTTTFPLPVVQAQVLQFDWLPEIASRLKFQDCDLPGGVVTSGSPLSFLQRLFGPLARPPGAATFNPWSLDDWSRLLTPGSSDTTVDVTEQTHARSPTAPTQIRFSVWNVRLTQACAWIALLACLLIGMGGRMLRSTILPWTALPWIALLAAASQVVPDVWATIAGGALSGTMVSLLLPRRLIRQTDLLCGLRIPAPEKVSTPKLGVAAGSVLAVTAATSWWTLSAGAQESTARAIDVAVVRSEIGQRTFIKQDIAAALGLVSRTNHVPQQLIRSVRYDISDTGQALDVLADYDVLIRDSGEQQILDLPLSQVVFPADRECRVDGQQVQVIPGIDGQSVLVALPTPAETAPATSTSNWSKRKVELKFLIRATSPTGTRYSAGIPTVLDSQLSGSGANLVSAGIQDPGLAGAVWLGPRGQLRSARASIQSLAGEARAFTHFEIAPLGMHALQTLEFKNPSSDAPTSDWRSLKVLLPPQCLVTRVTAPGEVRWQSRDDNGQRRLDILLSANDSAEGPQTVTIAYESPRPRQGDDTFTLPLPRLEALNVSDWELAVSAPVGWNVSPVVSQGLIEDEIDLERWRAAIGHSLPRVLWTGRGTKATSGSTQATALWKLTPPGDNWGWNCDQSFRILSDQLVWQARLESSAPDGRALFEPFELPVEVNVTGVTAVQSGRQRAVRYSRRGELLSLFFTDELSGPITITIEGQAALPTEFWTKLPLLRSGRRAFDTTELSLHDETFWSVELQQADGTATRHGNVLPRGGEPRLIAKSTEAASFPVALRLVPGPDAARAQIASSIERSEDEWRMSTLLHVRAQTGLLRRVLIEIPAGQSYLSLEPARLEHVATAQPDGSTLLRITVPRGRGPSFHCQLTTRLDADPVSTGHVSGVAVSSALVEGRWLMLPRALGVRAPIKTGEAVSPADLPPWAALAWSEELARGDSEAFALQAPDLKLAAEPAPQLDPRAPLSEVFLWPPRSAMRRGAGTWWIVGSNGTPIHCRLPKGSVFLAAFADGSNVLPEREASESLSLTLNRPRDVIPLSLHWEIPATSPVQWPVLDGCETGPQLISIADGQLQQSAHVRSVTPVAASLDRLAGLLECVAYPRLSLGLDSTVLDELRHSLGRTRELSKFLPPEDSVAAAGRLEGLEGRWRQLQSRIFVLSETQPTTDKQVSQTALPNRVDDDAAHVMTYRVSDAGAVVAKNASSSVTATSLSRMGLVAVLLVTLLLAAWMLHARERLARYPAITLVFLGVAWWLLLTPSFAGFVIAVWGAAAQLLRWIRLLTLSRRTATATT